ncbi:hypothetical protein JOF29_001625 [Kribbella aluminosa]|uniref:Uncharacterized protein n=1 Tax=Kribbella aluminosa TaxID=416017 RepID=A0ABS4UFW8_9ACTN|nr:hypothetical protein [Kribbella aluminosa]MBP2350542.1 hypothetical protein [Kribbella aluminosa]
MPEASTSSQSSVVQAARLTVTDDGGLCCDRDSELALDLTWAQGAHR